MGIPLEESKKQVLKLIDLDKQIMSKPVELDSVSPDGDRGKFVLEGKLARVIYPRDGFYLNINRDWFAGSVDPPKVNITEFHWYVFALEGGLNQVTNYFICDYLQIRQYALEFNAPTVDIHRAKLSWRGQIHILGDRRGYFRWGDEPKDDLSLTSRYIDLRNIAAAVGYDQLPDSVVKAIATSVPAVNDLYTHRSSLENVEQTERDAIVRSRLGQGRFRDDLLNYWNQCAVTGCREPILLRASHIKPWRDSSNRERLDPLNGLLLVPTLDAAFDAGLISFADDGQIIISNQLSSETQKLIGISASFSLTQIESRHLPYLAYHREHILRK